MYTRTNSNVFTGSQDHEMATRPCATISHRSSGTARAPDHLRNILDARCRCRRKDNRQPLADTNRQPQVRGGGGGGTEPIQRFPPTRSFAPSPPVLEPTKIVPERARFCLSLCPTACAAGSGTAIIPGFVRIVWASCFSV